MSKPLQMPFLWVPGQGPDAKALKRMQKAFPKPRNPMGEAWFMSEERRMFPALLDELDIVPDEEIVAALTEIASGTCSFGQHEEWSEWYHHLLPLVIDRRWNWQVFHPLEVVMTGFMAQHPEPDSNMPYRDFRTDALQTLGQYLMSPRLWPNDELDAARCLNKFKWPSGISGWFKCSGLLSASLFLCLKYLPEGCVSPWLESVFAIADPRWQAQLAVWLVGAHAILTNEIGQPGQFPEDGPFGISWDWSHVLTGNYSGSHAEPIILTPFLPAASKDAALSFARSLDLTEFFENLFTDPELDEIASETAGLPERFEALYGRNA
jgi:hypothetical protein